MAGLGRRRRFPVGAFSVAVAIVACGGRARHENERGRGGSSGSQGGAGGSVAGGAARSGESGSGGAGAAGAGGTVDLGPECRSDADCRMVSDCCGCRAEPKARPSSCALPCVRDACAEALIADEEFTCDQGRCVVHRTCDRAKVLCDSLPPSCMNDLIPSVTDEGCWGPCLAPADCYEVTSCDDCTGGEICVETVTVEARFWTCVEPRTGCTRGDYCSCLGACPAGGTWQCIERPTMVSCGDNCVQCN